MDSPQGLALFGHLRDEVLSLAALVMHIETFYWTLLFMMRLPHLPISVHVINVINAQASLLFMVTAIHYQ